ncbi:MAG: pentapeptide repeat-containing protein, partial [Halobacteriaceae archaeon]
MSDATTCEYEFDPGKHNHTSSPHVLRDILNDREVWSCPHPTYKNEDKCIFHTPEIHDSDAARELLLNQLDKNDSDREVHRFIGAKVDELSLDRTVIDARRVYALDLRFADIGTLDLEHTQISIPIDLTGSNIEKLNCHNAHIRSRLECKDAVISHCRGESATFHDRTLFEGTQFKRANFFNVTFEERALFSKSKFGGYTIFRNSDFHHMADFSETTWENQSSFASTKFHEQTDFTDITIHGELSITESMFESKCRLKPQPPQDDSTVLIDLTGTTITTGELANPGTNRLQYDLTEATLGDVELAGENPVNFANYQILNTSFDGFEFARYTDSLLAVNWYIHTSKTPPTIDSGSRSPSTIRQRVHQFYLRLKWIANMARRDEYSPGILRSTYLRAKNGAAIVGDDTAMAEFFLREMKYK